MDTKMMIQQLFLICLLTSGSATSQIFENDDTAPAEDDGEIESLSTELAFSQSPERDKRTTPLPNDFDIMGQMLNSIYYTKALKIPPIEMGDEEFEKKVCTNLPWTKKDVGNATEPTVEESTINNHPYLVQIMVDEKFRCSGTLISRLHVMTAAKCVVQFIGAIETINPSRFAIRVGSTYLYRGGEIGDVSKVVTHPKYHWSTSVLDLAILTLGNCVTLSNKVKLAVIHPDCGLIERIEANVPTQAPGWGFKKSSTYKSTSVLHVDNEYLYENGDCHNIYKYGKHKNHTYFPIFCLNACTGIQDDGLKKASKCQGDVGGPVYYQHKYFIAVVLFRRGCLFPKYPTFSSVICLDHEWIKKETNNLNPECSTMDLMELEDAVEAKKSSSLKEINKNISTEDFSTFPVVAMIAIVVFIIIVYEIMVRN